MTHCDVILYTPTFSKPAFIFKTCLHFQNLPSFSKPAFIFKTCLHFQNLPSFSKPAFSFCDEKFACISDVEIRITFVTKRRIPPATAAQTPIFLSIWPVIIFIKGNPTEKRVIKQTIP